MGEFANGRAIHWAAIGATIVIGALNVVLIALAIGDMSTYR
jgi:manganese transport protein